jgi:starch synthase (maltosyl-transferring)
MIARLNAIRQDNPALQELSNITFLDAGNEAIVAYAKQTHGNTVICVVNIDPHEGQSGWVLIPASLGLAPSITVHDLLTDDRYQWRIGHNFVGLAPGWRQAHVLRVER